MKMSPNERVIRELCEITSAYESDFAERFRVAIEAIDGLDCAVSASFGISTCLPQTGGRSDFDPLGKQLIGEADRALYHSNHLGRNRVSHFGAIGVTDCSA